MCALRIEGKTMFSCKNKATTAPGRRSAAIFVLTLLRVVAVSASDDVVSTGRIGDLDADGVVDTTDLLTLLDDWRAGRSTADLDMDGAIGAADLLALVANWDFAPPFELMPTTVIVTNESELNAAIASDTKIVLANSITLTAKVTLDDVSNLTIDGANFTLTSPASVIAANANTSGIKVQRITLTGGGGSSDYGFETQWQATPTPVAQNVELREVHVTDCETGFLLRGVSGLTMRDCSALRMTKYSIWGSRNFQNVTIDNFTVTDGSDEEHAIRIREIDNVVIRGCNITHTDEVGGQIKRCLWAMEGDGIKVVNNSFTGGRVTFGPNDADDDNDDERLLNIICRNNYLHHTKTNKAIEILPGCLTFSVVNNTVDSVDTTYYSEVKDANANAPKPVTAACWRGNYLNGVYQEDDNGILISDDFSDLVNGCFGPVSGSGHWE